jgi:hypothetical protein
VSARRWRCTSPGTTTIGVLRSEVLGDLKLFFWEKRRLVYLLFGLVILRKEGIPRVTSERLIKIAVVANKRRNIKIISIFWGLVIVRRR